MDLLNTTTMKSGRENESIEDTVPTDGLINRVTVDQELVLNEDQKSQRTKDSLPIPRGENKSQPDEGPAQNNESGNHTAENEDVDEIVPTERSPSSHFDKISAIVKYHRQSAYSVFSVYVEALYMHNISISPEFSLDDVTWSCIIFPNGIGKDKAYYIDLGFQIKSYTIQNPKRQLVYTVSILSKGIEYFRRETDPFYLGPRGQQADGFMIPVQDFGDKEILGDLIDEMGEIKFRVEMDIKLDLTLLEQIKRYFGWVHIKWMLCRGKTEEWNRAMSLLDEEHRRVGESFRVLSTITSLQTAHLQRQTEHFASLLSCIAELNAIAPENVSGDTEKSV